MKCDKCGKEVGEYIQRFHKTYAEYCNLNQVNGFCKKCWYEIVDTYGTWLDIQVSIATEQFRIPVSDTFKREYEAIWVSSRK